MKTPLSPHLSPTSCLEVDSPAARELTWLPYAVRFKLDACGLTMSLRDCQGLSIAQRMALVCAPLAPGVGGFELLARAIGGAADAPGAAPQRLAVVAEDLQAVRVYDIEAWLACATPFARYVIGKMASKKQVHEAT